MTQTAACNVATTTTTTTSSSSTTGDSIVLPIVGGAPTSTESSAPSSRPGSFRKGSNAASRGRDMRGPHISYSYELSSPDTDAVLEKSGGLTQLNKDAGGASSTLRVPASLSTSGGILPSSPLSQASPSVPREVGGQGRTEGRSEQEGSEENMGEGTEGGEGEGKGKNNSTTSNDPSLLPNGDSNPQQQPRAAARAARGGTTGKKRKPGLLRDGDTASRAPSVQLLDQRPEKTVGVALLAEDNPINAKVCVSVCMCARVCVCVCVCSLLSCDETRTVSC